MHSNSFSFCGLCVCLICAPIKSCKSLCIINHTHIIILIVCILLCAVVYLLIRSLARPFMLAVHHDICWMYCCFYLFFISFILFRFVHFMLLLPPTCILIRSMHDTWEYATICVASSLFCPCINIRFGISCVLSMYVCCWMCVWRCLFTFVLFFFFFFFYFVSLHSPVSFSQ